MKKHKSTLLLLGASLVYLPPNYAHGPEPMSLLNVPIPPVPGLLDGVDPIVVDKDKAIALGKALFWDTSVGSDGLACGSCHFHAFADSRIKNQINPGTRSLDQERGNAFDELPSGPGSGGPNYTLTKRDFPTFQFNNPFVQDNNPIFETDDVISSSGTFSGTFQNASRFSGKDDQCERAADPVFHVNSTGTRRVEPRNTPTVINAIFNERNFWDGRANNVFNGSSPWGDRDPDAGVWVRKSARSVEKQRLRLINSSLASLSVGPPLDEFEMSCRGRKWPNIGRKLLLRQPLQNQKVHPEDSVLGGLSLSTPGHLKNGLNTTYRNLIRQAFNSKYWSFPRTGPFGTATGQAPYNQMEANFSMFFGLALQLYQGTLVSDQAPIDLTPRDPNDLRPTWEGMGYNAEEINSLKLGNAAFTQNHCNLCHAGPLMTTAAIVTNSHLSTPIPGATFGPEHSPIPYGPNALGAGEGAYAAGISPHPSVVNRDLVLGGNKLHDMGFANTGVNDPHTDPGLANTDDFGNPLSYSAQYVEYLKGNYDKIVDDSVRHVRSCDFVQSIARNTSSSNIFRFHINDGIERDGGRPGETLRIQDCIDFEHADQSWIPTITAANNPSHAAKLMVAETASFKIPSLRNIDLTGPFMHNGSMSTLDQVLEFYGRRGNNHNPDQNFNVIAINLNNPQRRKDLIAFMNTFTDERVRYSRAPFDHPEIVIPHGHSGDHEAVLAGDNPISTEFAKEEFLTLPAVGANGTVEPIKPFIDHLPD